MYVEDHNDRLVPNNLVLIPNSNSDLESRGTWC